MNRSNAEDLLPLKTYAFFHLNLAYSAIEEERHGEVIRSCYRPLLDLVEDLQLPVGIEASAWTLERAAILDPGWFRKLKRLVNQGTCEFIGSGYTQLIGPLVPPEVNSWNLRLGMARYEELLGVRPQLALVNEQAFSAGLVPIYLQAGFRAILMEWNNPARANPAWDPEWCYFPQIARGAGGTEIPVIWNKSISFQKVQRLVHGEIELKEYLAYVRSHLAHHIRAFPVYGNDVEVFGFRPGRYMTEAPLQQKQEWARLRKLFTALLSDQKIKFIRPGAVLDVRARGKSGHRLRLETAAHPIPVKKQDKYNVVRWAVTGRNDLNINTRCWQIYSAMRGSKETSPQDWKELCRLWGSDFRTHVTEKKWKNLQRHLKSFSRRWVGAGANPTTKTPNYLAQKILGKPPPPRRARGGLKVERLGRFLNIQGNRLQVRLNCQRGLAVESFLDREFGTVPLFGTLHHGYFDDIQWAADFYSGFLVWEGPGKSKVTDLSNVSPTIQRGRERVEIVCRIRTPMGEIEKSWVLDDARGVAQLSYRLNWPEPTLGSLRLGHLLLKPEAFEKKSLGYAVHNGGYQWERFRLGASSFDHGENVSFLVSANQAVGLTGGVVRLGDRNLQIHVEVDKEKSSLVGMVSHNHIGDSHLTRVAFSAREMDDTSYKSPLGMLETTITYFVTQKQKSSKN